MRALFRLFVGRPTRASRVGRWRVPRSRARARALLRSVIRKRWRALIDRMPRARARNRALASARSHKTQRRAHSAVLELAGVALTRWLTMLAYAASLVIVGLASGGESMRLPPTRVAALNRRLYARAPTANIVRAA